LLKTDDIHIRTIGKAGRITLTRPQALNAMTYEMCMSIGRSLDEWEKDDAVSIIIIDAEGSKSFCAGGDIADLYKTGMAGDFAYGQKFWADEYRINAKIKNYPKPYIAIMDGIVMGGGVGISAHGSHRIVTENTLFAMPECGIGLVPDVGGNFFLSRAKGAIGEYLGATGARLKASDCIYAGIADYYVPDEDLETLTIKLETTGDLSIINQFSRECVPGNLALNQKTIDTHFAKTDAKAIITSLEADGDDWELNAAKLMRRNCPLSVACGVEIVRAARNSQTIEDILKLEYRFTHRSMEHGDFLEGIRAQIIDKDRKPNWKPSTLEELTQDKINSMLGSLGADELTFQE